MRLIHDLPGHRDAVGALAFSPDGTVLASGDEAGRLRHWDLAAGFPRAVVVLRSPVNTLAFLPGGKAVLAGCGDTEARESFGTADARPLARFGLDGSLDRYSVDESGLVDFVTGIVVGAGGRLALLEGGRAYTAGDGFAGHWRERAAASVLWDVARKQAIWCTRLAPGVRPGSMRLSVSKAIHQVVDDRSLVLELPRAVTVPEGVAIAHQGHRALAWDRARGELRLWDAPAREWLGSCAWPLDDEPAGAAIAPDLRTLAVGSLHGRVWVLALDPWRGQRGGLEPEVARVERRSGLEPALGYLPGVQALR